MYYLGLFFALLIGFAIMHGIVYLVLRLECWMRSRPFYKDFYWEYEKEQIAGIFAISIGITLAAYFKLI